MPLSAQRRDEGFRDIGGAVTEWLRCHLGLSILAVMSSGGHNVCFALCTDDLDKIRQFVGAYDYDQICVAPPLRQPRHTCSYPNIHTKANFHRVDLADEIPRAPFSFASGKYGRLVDPSPAPRPIAVLASLDRELRQHIDIPFFNSALPPTPAPVPEPVPPALVPPAPVPTPAVEPTNLPAQEQVDSECHDLPNRHWVFRKPRLAEDLPHRKWHPPITSLSIEEGHWERRNKNDGLLYTYGNEQATGWVNNQKTSCTHWGFS
ncbi:hypothetical protein BS47DRAFT_1369963 [Hydnum rufescens UP504]|uniref:Uncharacterized protein n=1 Tax=Hydnum rufescens UP504 TaxID=1448309 RepID=A0A9P6DL23_9AGAM|nr:hypothetical protein BS47DRAFT_1369963 [Hydnum rufescens UP504]